MDTQKLLKRLNELNSEKNKLTDKLRETENEMNSITWKLHPNLTGMCFKNTCNYFKVIEDKGKELTYISVGEDYIILTRNLEKEYFTTGKMSNCSEEEFNKALEETYNRLKEL